MERDRSETNNVSYGQWLIVLALHFSLLILGVVYGCGEDKDNPVFQTTLTLKNSTGQTATVFASGDLITLELTIRNLTDVSQTLTIPAQSFDFLVLQGSPLSIIWQLSNGQVIPGIVTEMHFAPREEKMFSDVWNQTNNDGTPVGIGDFAAQGFIGTLPELQNQTFEATETRSPLVPFSIVQ